MVPPPKTMLERSDLVAIARMSKSDGDWILTVADTLKGTPKAGARIEMSSEFPPNLFDFEGAYGLVRGEPFLFVGILDPVTGTARPRFGVVSFWPQGDVLGKVLPVHSLGECVDFAKENLGAPCPQPPADPAPPTGATIPITENPDAHPVTVAEQTTFDEKQIDQEPSDSPNGHGLRGALIVGAAAALGIMAAIFHRRARKT